MQGHKVPTREMIKTPQQIAGIREAGRMNTMVLDHAEKYIKEGISTEELNVVIDEYTRELGGIPAPLNYEGYPKSVCISIDDVVCHGIPDKNTITRFIPRSFSILHSQFSILNSQFSITAQKRLETYVSSLLGLAFSPELR